MRIETVNIDSLIPYEKNHSEVQRLLEIFEITREE